jgi:YggT family protein
MILLANLMMALGRIIHFVLMLYIWVLVFRAILSWIHAPSLYQIKIILYHLTEPVLRPVRRFVPPYKFGGIDLSPIVVFIILLFIDSFLVKSLMIYAQQMLQQPTYTF